MKIKVTFDFDDMTDKQIDSVIRCFRRISCGELSKDEEPANDKEEELPQLPFQPYADAVKDDAKYHNIEDKTLDGVEDVFPDEQQPKYDTSEIDDIFGLP